MFRKPTAKERALNNIAGLLLAKEAVASHNIEHPDNPITLEEYFMSVARGQA